MGLCLLMSKAQGPKSKVFLLNADYELRSATFPPCPKPGLKPVHCENSR